MNETFKSKDNSVVINKTEPTVKKAPAKEKLVAKKLDCDKLIDTAFSYHIPGLETLVFGKGQKCLICGEMTSYDNRHVCIKCWKEHKDEILKALKEMLKDKTLEIK